MGKAVLKSISAENFASFADKIVFTCVADGSKKESAMNTFEAGEEVINKVSYIYGANGSGKTFFCKILREIQRMIVLSPLSVSRIQDLRRLIPKLISDLDGFRSSELVNLSILSNVLPSLLLVYCESAFGTVFTVL